MIGGGDLSSGLVCAITCTDISKKVSMQLESVDIIQGHLGPTDVSLDVTNCTFLHTCRPRTGF